MWCLKKLLQAGNKAAKESAGLSSRALPALKRARPLQANTHHLIVLQKQRGQDLRGNLLIWAFNSLQLFESIPIVTLKAQRLVPAACCLLDEWEIIKVQWTACSIVHHCVSMVQCFVNNKLNYPHEKSWVKRSSDIESKSDAAFPQENCSSNVDSGLRCFLEVVLKHVLKNLNERNQHRTIIVLSSVQMFGLWHKQICIALITGKL
jgi:hypothetical protein